VIDLEGINVTQISESPFVQEWREKGTGSARSDASDEQVHPTQIVSGFVLLRSQGPVSGTATARPATNWETERIQERSPIEIASDSRVMLLTKKYETGASKEELARIEILSNRLDKLVPRTTSADIDKLDATVQLSENIARDLNALAVRFGLE